MAGGVAPHHPPIPIIKVEKGIEELGSFLVPNENGDLTCRKCDRAFQDKELAIKHMSCHEDEKSFECYAKNSKNAPNIHPKSSKNRLKSLSGTL